MRGFHRGPVNSPHKWPVTRKMFPFADVIMVCEFRNVNVTWRALPRVTHHHKDDDWVHAQKFVCIRRHTLMRFRFIITFMQFLIHLLTSVIISYVDCFVLVCRKNSDNVPCFGTIFTRAPRVLAPMVFSPCDHFGMWECEVFEYLVSLIDYQTL